MFDDSQQMAKKHGAMASSIGHFKLKYRFKFPMYIEIYNNKILDTLECSSNDSFTNKFVKDMIAGF